MQRPDGSRTGEPRTAGSTAGLAFGPTEDQVRTENSTAIPLLWPSFELSWRTSRWWPSLTGWKVIAPVFIFVVFVLWEVAARLANDPTPVTANAYPLVLAFAMVPILVAIAVVEIWPKAHQRPGHWVMRVSSDSISVSVIDHAPVPLTATIVRSEAGRLTLDFTDEPTGAQGTFGRHLGRTMFGVMGAVVMRKVSPPRSMPQSASALSLDGQTVISLTRTQAKLTWPVAPGTICPLDVLIAWWPLNSRSRVAFRDYEATGYWYWHPPNAWPQTTKFPPAVPTSTEPASSGSADPAAPLRWT